jgi:hypothetical protein
VSRKIITMSMDNSMIENNRDVMNRIRSAGTFLTIPGWNGSGKCQGVRLKQ